MLRKVFGNEYQVTRLLFMGILYPTEYETREGSKNEPGVSVLQTPTGSVEHNGGNGLPSERLPGEQEQAIRPPADMANDLLTQPPTDSEATLVPAGHELDAFLGKAFDEKPVWQTLYENIRDVFFPAKLPPLELTSTPIPVPDRMAVKANPWAIGISTTFNVIVVLLAIWLGIHVVQNIVKPPLQATNIDVGTFDLKAPKAGVAAGGGGGGGSHDIVDPIKGKLPAADEGSDHAADDADFGAAEAGCPSGDQRAAEHPTARQPEPAEYRRNKVGECARWRQTARAAAAAWERATAAAWDRGLATALGPEPGGNAGGGVYQIGGGVSAPVAIFHA